MNRETISDAATFAAVVAGAFFFRNALVMTGLGALLAFGLFSN